MQEYERRRGRVAHAFELLFGQGTFEAAISNAVPGKDL